MPDNIITKKTVRVRTIQGERLYNEVDVWISGNRKVIEITHPETTDEIAIYSLYNLISVEVME